MKPNIIFVILLSFCSFNFSYASSKKLTTQRSIPSIIPAKSLDELQSNIPQLPNNLKERSTFYIANDNKFSPFSHSTISYQQIKDRFVWIHQCNSNSEESTPKVLNSVVVGYYQETTPENKTVIHRVFAKRNYQLFMVKPLPIIDNSNSKRD